jgi:hypothetical protein
MPTAEERLTELEKRLTDLLERYESRDRWLRLITRDLNRKINIGVSVLAGALQIYSANLLVLDVTIANDRWAEWMLLSGLACIGIGVLALFGKEDELIEFLTHLIPWRRD